MIDKTFKTLNRTLRLNWSKADNKKTLSRGHSITRIPRLVSNIQSVISSIRLIPLSELRCDK